MLAFGAIFEMPLLIYFLAWWVVTHRGLWKFSRWFIVLAFIIGAILTPGPDVVSQLMMALPMITLYNVSILLAWRVTIRRERADAALGAQNDSAQNDKPVRSASRPRSTTATISPPASRPARSPRAPLPPLPCHAPPPLR